MNSPTSFCLTSIKRAGFVGVALLLAACVSNAPKMDYTAFKESRPRSILVMPPINVTPEEKASMSFLATVTFPLAESGYYVIPVTLSEETFKQNGVNVAEEAQNIDLSKLRDIFGADAALYITVERFGTSYKVFDSVTEAGASARLVDLKSGREIWQGTVKIAQSSNQNNSGGLVGMLVGAIIHQVSNSLNDKKGQELANIANKKLLFAGHQDSILYGHYHPKFGTE